MPSIDRPQAVVTVNAQPKNSYGGDGTVDLQIAEGGTISLTPGEARQLAELLRNSADEAETELAGRKVTVRADRE